MEISYQYRLYVGVCILLFALLSPSIRLLDTLSYKPTMAVENDIAIKEARFKRLTPFLPLNTTVGYLTENNDVILHRDSHAAWEFSIAQYTIIPTTITLKHESYIVIGNFKQTPSTAFLNTHNVKIREDLGDGLFILERKESQ